MKIIHIMKITYSNDVITIWECESCERTVEVIKTQKSLRVKVLTPGSKKVIHKREKAK